MVKHISNAVISALAVLGFILLGVGVNWGVVWVWGLYLILAVWLWVLAIAGIRAKHDVPPKGNPLGEEY